jgi:Flp pilus assembly protein TadD
VSGRQNNFLAQALHEAAMALRMKQFGRAEQIATDVLRSSRTDRNAVLILAHALMGQDRVDEAVAPLERIARRSRDAEIETMLGAALCGSRRAADGIAQLRRAAALRPPYLAAFQELASQFAKAGQLCEAIRTIEDGLVLAPENIDLKVDLGRLCLQNNERAKARAILTVAREAAPARPDILKELGLVLLLDGEYTAAAAIFRNTLALHPEDTFSRVNLAACLLEMGERDSGEATLRSAVRGRAYMFGRAAYALTASSHGRFFFRPSAAAKFLERDAV